MSITVTGIGGLLKALENQKEVPDKMVRQVLEKVLVLVHKGVTMRTPVHTGKSLRNWVWTMDAPSSSANLPAIGSGDPGRTSQMALGSEPRRSANQAAVDGTFAMLDLSRPMRAYWLTNRSAEIMDLEYGKLPSPGRSRSPAGMAAITFQEALALVGA